jgi:hypothetical protein
MAKRTEKGRSQAEPEQEQQGHDGPDRRTVADRRATRRGGRRATDSLRKAMKFAYDLLTEPPG